MKKITALLFLLSTGYLSAITTNMSHRTVSTSPLLYTTFDNNTKPKLLGNDSGREISFDIAPYYSSMYDTAHTMNNLTPNGLSTLNFNQQGRGDVNPFWFNLESNNSSYDYSSLVTLTPSLSLGGVLLQFCQEFEHFFIDVRSALLECTAEIEITEVGGGNGFYPGIMNAQQAFTQSAWNFGKIGKSNRVVGLDNIQFALGGYGQVGKQSHFDTYLLGSFLLELPTGQGTTAEWLFEPRIGTNHWALGFRGEALMCNEKDIQFLLGGDYRYFIAAWETRSFDLTDNGPWSRYLGVQDTYNMVTNSGTQPLTLPGINYFTQRAEIGGRNQLNLYARLRKQLRHCEFELSYNYFYGQAETINAIANVIPGFGIYTLTGPAGGGGGLTTSSTAMINQDVTAQDLTPVNFSSASFDKNSAAAGAYATNSFVANIRRVEDTYNYGIGASIEAALSASAISSWAVWARFEYIFSN